MFAIIKHTAPLLVVSLCCVSLLPSVFGDTLKELHVRSSEVKLLLSALGESFDLKTEQSLEDYLLRNYLFDANSESALKTCPEAELVLKEAITPKSKLPVVIMHGMGDAADHQGMQQLRQAVGKHLGVYAVNVAIGNTTSEDMRNSYFMNLNKQVESFTRFVKNDSKLSHGFNAIGLSQGNLIVRGYIERDNTPPVHNWISVHGPHGGIAELPSCKSGDSFCQRVTELIGSFAYSSWVQEHVAQANYFRDPLRIGQYLQHAKFLPDINNEKNTTKPAYKQNFLTLKSLALVKATEDATVMPKESEWFGAMKDGNFSVTLGMNETKWYKEDLFGLRSLDEAGKIFKYTTAGAHMQFKMKEFLEWVDKHFVDN